MHRASTATGELSPANVMLRTALLYSAVSVPALTVVLAFARPDRGGLSALIGAVVAVGFFVLGHVGVRAVVSGEPALSLPGALVVYAGQLIALIGIYLVVRRAGWVDGPAFAIAAILQTLVWQAGQITGFRRSRHEIYPDVTLPGPGRT